MKHENAALVTIQPYPTEIRSTNLAARSLPSPLPPPCGVPAVTCCSTLLGVGATLWSVGCANQRRPFGAITPPYHCLELGLASNHLARPHCLSQDTALGALNLLSMCGAETLTKLHAIGARGNFFPPRSPTKKK